MKKSKFLAVVAFLAAIVSVFAFTAPPPTPYGKHSTLGAIAGVIDGTDNCGTISGSQCKVYVGTGSEQELVDAFSDQQGAANQDSNKRLRRPPM